MLMKAVFRFGYNYQKVGLVLKVVVSDYHLLGRLFTNDPDERQRKLSDMVNRLNHQYGRTGRGRLRLELAP